jgi:hypothetical protein
MFVTLNDTTNGAFFQLPSEDFTNQDCSTTDIQVNLPPGITRIVSLPVLTSDPTGHSLQATIAVYSGANLSGTSVTQTINFTP